MPDPTPKKLRDWAKWFDNPNESPGFALQVGTIRQTPGFLLRRIADGLERHLRPDEERREDDA